MSIPSNTCILYFPIFWLSYLIYNYNLLVYLQIYSTSFWIYQSTSVIKGFSTLVKLSENIRMTSKHSNLFIKDQLYIYFPFISGIFKQICMYTYKRRSCQQVNIMILLKKKGVIVPFFCLALSWQWLIEFVSIFLKSSPTLSNMDFLKLLLIWFYNIYCSLFCWIFTITSIFSYIYFLQ